MSPGTYVAVEREEDEDEGASESVLGTVTLAADGRLAIVSEPDPEDDRLQVIVDEMNAEDTLHVDAPPPAEARPFEVYTRIVKRNTDAFIPALLEHMKRYYDVELRPA